MVKIRLAGNRLSVGSFSVPFGRSDSQRKRQSRSIAVASPPPPPKEADMSNGSASESVVPVAPPTKQISLVELAKIITRESEKLEKYLKESGSPMPGFDVDSPANFPKLPDEMKKAREEIVRATKELGDLVTGPTESVRWMAWDVGFLVCSKVMLLT